jgi:hypothetical protein
MVHWQDNPASTNSLVIDFSDVTVPNTAVIKYPGQPFQWFGNFLGGGAPNMSFHVRVYTVDPANPFTNNEVLHYNVYKGYAGEFPDITNWNMINSSPVTGTTFTDNTWQSADSLTDYRYAVQTIYTNGVSEVTFSDTVNWSGFTSIIEFAGFTTEIKVYPVPATDFIEIQFESTKEVSVTVSMYNSSVQLADYFITEKNKYINLRRNVSSMPSGNYILTFNIEGKLFSKKVVVIKR